MTVREFRSTVREFEKNLHEKRLEATRAEILKKPPTSKKDISKVRQKNA